MLFKGKGEKEGEDAVDPAADPTADPTATDAGVGGATPTAGTDPTAGMTPTGTTTAPGAPGAGTGAGGLQGQQVGPYTVVPDPQSGQMVVFETATQQPVGILDAQGTLVPLEEIGRARQGAGLGTGEVPTGPTSSVPQAQAQAQAQAGAQYETIARDLFANAGNGGVGTATSDAMAGQTNLAPVTGFDAGATSAAGLGAGTGVPSSTDQVRAQQLGNYTLIDDGSGIKVVLDTASQQPIAMMDAAGTITPLSVDAAGNVTVTGAPVNGAATGASSLGVSPAPTGVADAYAGASPYASPATVTSPSMVAAPNLGLR